jgi:hypothetical protein
MKVGDEEQLAWLGRIFASIGLLHPLLSLPPRIVKQILASRWVSKSGFTTAEASTRLPPLVRVS